MLEQLYISEPNDVLVTGLANDATGAYVNSATVTAEVRTSGASPTSGSRVGSQFSLSYVASSNGNYRGTFPASDAAGLTEDTEYWIWITASGYTLRRIACIATYRGKA